MPEPIHLNEADVLPQYVEYGSGYFAGVELKAEVKLSPGLVVQQSIGAAFYVCAHS